MATDTATDIEFALLCTSATFRDGLLSVLEAGLEEFHPPALPAVIEPSLVFKVAFAPEDVDHLQVVRAFVAALEPEVMPPRPGNRPGRLVRCGLDTQGRKLEIVLNEHGQVVNAFRPRS